jgi:hypothetical protein
MAAKRWKIMAHAVQRYRERYAPGLTEEEAHIQLLRLAYESVRLPERTHAGDSIFQVDGHLSLVAKETKQSNICVTIIPGLTQMEVEIMRDAARDLPVTPQPLKAAPPDVYRSRAEREFSKSLHIELLQKKITQLNKQLKIARAFIVGLKGKEAQGALKAMSQIRVEEEKEEV